MVGGAETQALYLAKGLREVGFKVIIGAFGSEEGEGYLRFKNEGFECIRWGFQEKLILYPEATISGYIRKWRYTRLLISKVKSLEIDRVIPFTYPANIIFCRWHKSMRVKGVFWNQRDGGQQFKGSIKEMRALLKASHIVTNSLEGHYFLRKFTNKNIYHIPNGVDIEKFSKDETTSTSKNVVMIGNLHGPKDHASLIHAWRKVTHYYPDWKLLLAGRVGDRFESCKLLVDSYNLSKSVLFLDLVTNIPSLLKDCHLAVYSSINEGVPNGVLEPMAAGLPVVASNILGTQEALGADYPFLVKPGNVEQFSNFILQLLGDADLRKEFGAKNRIRLSKNFSLEAMVNSYIDFLNA